MSPQQSSFSGLPNKAIVCDTLIDQTIVFIWDSLLPWRDDSDRPAADGEEELNGQLHDYLSSRAKELMPMIYFRHEQRQEGQRRVDIAAKPINTVIIQSNRYTPYQPILVIEGKRLPAPAKNREREYVSGENGQISGGIQRFKTGAHGKEHDNAIIVGYVQEKLPKDWHLIVNGWISELAKIQPDSWSENEKLSKIQCFDSGQRAKSSSEHSRVNGCKSNIIGLHHFWIQMN